MREPNTSSRAPVRRPVVAVLVVLSGIACASHRVLVPPRLDLTLYQRIGLVTFAGENAKGTLHEFATRRFEEEALGAQTGIEILELGSTDSVLRQTKQTELGAAAAQALGAARGVPAVFFGHLKMSNVKPSGGLIGLALPHLEATVSAELSVELVSTKSGGTLWRSSSAATDKVGQVAIVGGQPVFSARDPNDAYGRLVNFMVAAVTRDLRATWRDQ
jgi:hypothetical protein